MDKTVSTKASDQLKTLEGSLCGQGAERGDENTVNEVGELGLWYATLIFFFPLNPNIHGRFLKGF